MLLSSTVATKNQPGIFLFLSKVNDRKKQQKLSYRDFVFIPILGLFVDSHKSYRDLAPLSSAGPVNTHIIRPHYKQKSQSIRE